MLRELWTAGLDQALSSAFRPGLHEACLFQYFCLCNRSDYQHSVFGVEFAPQRVITFHQRHQSDSAEVVHALLLGWVYLVPAPIDVDSHDRRLKDIAWVPADENANVKAICDAPQALSVVTLGWQQKSIYN